MLALRAWRHQSTEHDWSRRYIDAVVLRDESTNSDDQRIHYLADANFTSPRSSTPAATPREQDTYVPYRVLSILDATWSNSRSTSADNNVYTYTGRRLDTETGVCYYRHRVYCAQLGRFGSRDPVGYGGGVNLQAYADSAPIVANDPYGLQSHVIALPQMIAAGWTAEEISAAFGITVQAAAAMIAAYHAEKAVEKLVENYQSKAKGTDPCELALNAMSQAEKSIRSREKVIREHQGYIRDPSTYPGVVRDIDDARRGWQRDINRAMNNIGKNRKALTKLRDLAKKACKCWYKPWYKPWDR